MSNPLESKFSILQVNYYLSEASLKNVKVPVQVLLHPTVPVW